MRYTFLLMLLATLQLASASTTSAQSSPSGAGCSNNGPQQQSKPKKLAIVLFDQFETLDVFGPVQMWARLADYELVFVSEHGGAVFSAQGFKTVVHYTFENAPQFDIIMIPGGGGTRKEVNNSVILEFLRKQDKGTEYTTSVCTGAAVLAKAGILDGRKATSNKNAFEFVTSQSANVGWQKSARWVVDGKYVTSSGISAGTDMALGLIEKIYGREEAERIAHNAEYIWNDDPDNDPFAIEE